MTDLPAEAITADLSPAALAARVDEAYQRGRRDGAATERAAIIQLAREHNAQCNHADGGGGAFADLLGGES